MNRLSKEKSPYLLQHKDNPVDWYPWGEDAFLKAKNENKPIFLSIGYSTCHWCHVMEHETFENKEAAEILNKHFISVKVDREERPDVDVVYMEVCQLMNGSGGWPLTVFLDTEKQPFFAGTYYPTSTFKMLLNNINSVWKSNKSQLTDYATKLSQTLKTEKKAISFNSLTNVSESAFVYLKNNFDSKYGGFSNAPKFPSPHNIIFLLNHYKKSHDIQSLAMCETTLQAMRNGGLYDHVGGGFSRYSTDRYWLVPHFEKMLYDNALLMIAYSMCYEITKNDLYAETVKGTAEYLIRDMQNLNGGFYTAEDADSEGHEGLFYTFTHLDIYKALGNEGSRFCDLYNITQSGNFEGRNIINTINNSKPLKVKIFSENCLKKLFNYRNERIRPHCDKKIMCGLNGLAIAGLCISGNMLNEKRFIKAAQRAADFILRNLIQEDGSLYSYYLEGPSTKLGFAENYAFLIFGLLELYKCTQDKTYLEKAISLQNIFTTHFYDNNKKGFFISDSRAETVIKRVKELYDGAVPSYNSVSMYNLFNLYKITDNTEYLQALCNSLAFFSDQIARFPAGHIFTVFVIDKITESLPEMQICYGNVCYPKSQNIDELIKIFK